LAIEQKRRREKGYYSAPKLLQWQSTLKLQTSALTTLVCHFEASRETFPERSLTFVRDDTEPWNSQPMRKTNLLR
jgi:hypothetical protein